ncbi:MAG: DUF4417 domain-containing protein [bacterium]|nr:DUF4417 domain-containing protein [bacterium]
MRIIRKPNPYIWEQLKNAPTEGRFEMTVLQPVRDAEPQNLIGFNEARYADNRQDKWFHFYIDDYQYECLWNDLRKYIPMLKQFAGGIGPDFSMYHDMKRAQQLWNCWRNRALAYIMQKEGILTVPNACWSDEESLEWAFDGLPEDSLLAVTTQACMGQDYVLRQALLNGLHELVRRKHPRKLVVYGKFPEEWKERFPMPIDVHPSFCEKKWRLNNG